MNGQRPALVIMDEIQAGYDPARHDELTLRHLASEIAAGAPSFDDVPTFASTEEADAWMKVRDDARDAMVAMAVRMDQVRATVTWWSGVEADDLLIGYSTRRMGNGKFAAVVINVNATPMQAFVYYREFRRRKDAKAASLAQFSRHCPKWRAKHDPNGEL